MLASQMPALGRCIPAVSLFAVFSLSLNFPPSLILQVSLRQIILSLHTLFTDPNPSNPLVPEVAKLYSQDRPAFEAKVREWVKEYGEKD